ncbi:unnamed protein product [Rotaria magnacalcarata]|uniref:FAD-binding FR-type domain-containing protein n=5 Tax=Rotaria magnacalcarata TaxID=392030 RepID=A0A816ZP93_9BILA|nr:unnamed protein product [Rotaria magnacalcarata]
MSKRCTTAHTVLDIDRSSRSNLTPPTMRNRQKAEIHLRSLLNESEKSLPAFVRRAGDNLGSEQLSVEQISKLLKTQEFLIRRLARIFYPSTENVQDVKTLTILQAQKLTCILNSTMEVRALVFFMILDEAGDEYVTRAGMTEFYEKYFKGLKTLDGDRIQEVVQGLLQKFHLNQSTHFENNYHCLDLILLECLSQFTVHPTWFMNSPSSQPAKQSKFQELFSNHCCKRENKEQKKNKLSIADMKNNLSRIIMLIIYLLINLGLVIYVICYRTIKVKSNVPIVFARICGMLLNFNCTFIIVLMLKQTILIIRSNKFLRKCIPVDDHIDFHKVVGRIIVVLSILHTIAHVVNVGAYNSHSWVAYLFTTEPNIGWVGGFASLSGLLLCIILSVIVVCSMRWIRRGGHFQVFYWSHLLYLPFYILLIIHATNFWKWIVGPLFIFLLEKVYSIVTRCSSRNGRTYIHSVTIEQSNVISLNIHRPKHFNFQSGDYVSINIPRVALYEFHPFTISSAPEEKDYIRVHIQATGDWTKQVYQRFKEMAEEEARENQIKIYRADIHPQESLANFQNVEHDQIGDQSNVKSNKREPIFIKGPYSSCARYVFDCKHVVLIGGGIGVTPYASILSSLMAQFRASSIACKHCNCTNYLPTDLSGKRRLQKVDFVWVNRDYKNFEWFLNLLRQFEQEQENYLALNPNEKRFLDLHLYFTEIKHDENIGNAPLELVTKTWKEVTGQDIFTRLQCKTHFGRPQWENLFHSFLSMENTSTVNDVSVFFCGPSSMGETIKNRCRTFRFRYYEEKF